MNRLYPVTVLLTLAHVMCWSGSASTLLTNSPFLPSDFQPPGTPGQAAPEVKDKQNLVFRGVYELGGVYYYNLYSEAEKKGQWVTERNAEGLGYEILDYNPSDDALSLLVGGEMMDLHLIETSDAPLALKGNSAARRAVAARDSSPPTSRRKIIRPNTGSNNPSTKQIQRRAVQRTPSKG